MSKQGLKLAVRYGLKRRRFDSFEAAEIYYSKLKKDIFDLVKKLNAEYPDELLDYSPISLKSIEKIYFEYFDNNKFSSDTITKDEFEILLAVYYGQVFVHNGKADWIIEEDVFVKDNRFYMATKSKNDFITIVCTRRKDHHSQTSNKRRQMIYREYKKYENHCTN